VLPEYYRGGGSLDTALSLGDTELRFGGSFMAMQSDDRTSAADDLTRNGYVRAGGYVEMDFTPVENTDITVKVYDTFYQRDNDAYDGAKDSWTTGEKHENENIAAFEALAVYKGLSRFLFTGGLEAAYNSMEHYDFTDPVSVDREAIFFQAEWFQEDKYSLLGGVRIERNSQFGFTAAPKLSGMYYLANGFRLLGGVGTGYRAPAFNELYREYTSRPGIASPYRIIPNADIKPEYSLGVNLGAEYTKQWGFLQVNWYYTELFDEIDTIDSGKTETIGTTVYRIDVRENIARSLRTGVDTEGQLNLPKNFFVSAGYSWIYAYDRTKEEEKHDQSAHTVKMQLGYSYKNDARSITRINTYLQGRFFSPRGDGVYDDDDPRFVIDFYFTIGLGQHFVLHTVVNNIMGKIYRFGPDTGQMMTLGLTYTL
jgi:outer membrane receptor for ferrienterochelin and colicins